MNEIAANQVQVLVWQQEFLLIAGIIMSLILITTLALMTRDFIRDRGSGWKVFIILNSILVLLAVSFSLYTYTSMVMMQTNPEYYTIQLEQCNP